MPTKVLIAIVDDDESVRQAIQGLMRSSGFAAESFARAEEFLGSSHRPRTALVIADIQMPGMSGVDLQRALVASGEQTPVILITAYPDDRVRMRALESGVICYLVKPFNEDDLLGCINDALGRHP